MNLLVTGAFACTEVELDKLREFGHSVVFMQQEREELPCDAVWVEGIIGNGIFLHHPIEKFVNLKYIQLTSAGYDRVPMNYVREHGIAIFNAGGVYSIPMAEFALCGVLELYKKNAFFRENQKAHKWEKSRDIPELFGKIVAIIGCGSVGTECAKRFNAFGCHVIGVDIKPYQSDHYAEMVDIAEINSVLSLADIVVLTLPLTDSTKHLMNKDAFSVMKNGAVIVNIARGGIVDTDALIKALKTHLGGAVLDVFEDEPLDEKSPLWDMENVIVTPHNSFVGEGNRVRMTNVIFENLALTWGGNLCLYKN